MFFFEEELCDMWLVEGNVVVEKIISDGVELGLGGIGNGVCYLWVWF